MNQRMRVILFVLVSVVCCAQLISMLQSSLSYNDFFYPDGRGVYRAEVHDVLSSVRSTQLRNSNEISPNQPSIDLMKVLSDRKRALGSTRNTESQNKELKSWILRPGKPLNQTVKRLSDGTNVGWLPSYNRTTYKLLHASPACKDNDVYVAVVVTAGKNFERRQAIRKTWGSQLKTVFVLGANSTPNARLEKEAQTHKDIVQADFREGYYNLTYNVITALRWVTIYCPMAEYIIKGDDDTWFNIDPLKTEVAVSADGPMILGRLFVASRRNKNAKSKWYTPDDVISQLTYPTFVSGAGYVVTRQAVPFLYNELLAEPLVLNLEDLFVTGFIADQLGIRRTAIREFHNHRFPKLAVNGCTYGGVLQSHEIKPNEMLKLWTDIRNQTLVC